MSCVQEDTGANVDVDSKSGVIKLRGAEEAIKAALAIITEVCGLDKKFIEIPLDPRATAVFVGKGGVNIKRLTVRRHPVASHFPMPWGV